MNNRAFNPIALFFYALLLSGCSDMPPSESKKFEQKFSCETTMDSAKKVIAEFDMQVKEIPASTHLLIASKGNTSYQLAYRNGSLVFLQKLASGSLASGAFEQAISYDLVLQCRESK